MNNTEQDKRSKHKDKGLAYKPGPIYNEDSIPYDYIVIIDAGSSGSRVYVYNWLNPLVGLEKGIDFRKLGGGLIRLVKRFHLDHRELEERTNEDKDVPERERGTTTEVLSKEDKQHGKGRVNKADADDKEESEDDTDIEDDDHVDTEEHSNDGDLDANNDHKQVDSDGKKGVFTKKPSKSKPKKGLNARLPVVKNGKKWHKKIRPGISSFNASPRKIGNHHIKGLLTMAASIVPKSQHFRTPVFLHSTAGMRLLNPTEQQTILDTICEYLQSNSDFFVPECSSHINVITGDVEGIYGWLSINSLIGSFDTPEQHNHGKNHTTYGLLDMGGASTQVVFSPNSTEIEEHQNNLYKIKLSNVPTLLNANATYSPPDPLEFDLYSDSFLGFGMFQAHNRYLSFLVDKYRKEHNIGPEDKYYNTIGAPVPDPCLPRGYVSSEVINDYKVDFTGESDFKECLNNIFPVLSNSTYSGTDRCKQIDEPEVSSCLLNDLIPAFDFDINHFFGVSGYWDAINSLLAYDEKLGKRKKKKKNKGKEEEKGNEESSDPKDGEASTYDYKVIYDKTSKLCAQSWSKLLEMNNKKKEKSQLDQDELSELCFKASWILNFLHVGLGFPRFGIDEATSHEKQKFQNLQLVESLGGSQFSWTLGRAILYANDEYVQAFNNYTLAHTTEMNDKSSDITPVRRPGFYHSASSNVYRYGAEQQNVVNRPAFVTPDPQAKYKYYDYEKGALGNDSELKWYIEPHRWYGIFILSFMMMFIFWLMLGKSGRNRLREKTSRFTGKVLFKFNQIVGAVTNKTFSEEMPYYRVANSSNQFVVEEDLEEGLELATITKNGNSSTDSQFTINSA